MNDIKRKTIEVVSADNYADIRNSLVALKERGESPFKLQQTIENLYSRKVVNKAIRAELETDEMLGAALFTAARMVELWIDEDHYESKNQSKQLLKGFDVDVMLLDFMTVLMQQDTSYFELTKVVGSMVQFTPWKDDYMVGIKRCAELLVKMAEADLFDVIPANSSALGQVTIQLPYGFDDELADAIRRSKFLPPMVCKPKFLKRNNQSGYLTHDSHRITKRLQRHSGDICLEVLNLVNATAYSLNMELLERVTDTFKPDEEKDVDVKTQQMLWEVHQERTAKTAIEMFALGNKFYFEWFVDYRGRMYDRGYELHLQGNDFKKAMIDFHEPSEIDGWEAYADDFGFELPTIGELYGSSESAEVQVSVQLDSICGTTNQSSDEIGDDLPWCETDSQETQTLVVVKPTTEHVELSAVPLF